MRAVQWLMWGTRSSYLGFVGDALGPNDLRDFETDMGPLFDGGQDIASQVFGALWQSSAPFYRSTPGEVATGDADWSNARSLPR